MGFYSFSFILFVLVRLKVLVIVILFGGDDCEIAPTLPTTGDNLILLPELFNPLLFLYIILSISLYFTLVYIAFK